MTELSTNLLERFVAADNKADVLKEVTPHSPVYRFIELMIALNDPARDPAGLEKEVRDFQTTRAKPEQREAVKLRLLLNQISAARNRPEEVKRLAGELNNFYLHYNFDAVNPFQTEFRNDLHNVEGGTPTATLSEQELKDITLEAALEKAYREISLSHLKPEYLEYVDLTRLDFQKKL